MMLAGLVLVPIANLLTPLFGIALMVHVHKHLDRGRIGSRTVDASRRLAGRG
jgi:CysZ protein